MKTASYLIPILLATPAFADGGCMLPNHGAQALEEARLIIEDNAGDGDFSLQASVGDESLTDICVLDPSSGLLFHGHPDGALGRMNLAGLTLETSEPTYGQMSYEALKAAFPEGDYLFRATDRDGEVLEGRAKFTTLLPMAPEIVTPPTVPDTNHAPVPAVPVADLRVEWKPVTASRDGRPLTIRGYRLWINKENHEDPNGFSRPNFDVHLGPDARSFVVPAAFFDAGSLYEIEVGAIEESGNQTLGGASFFKTE